MSVIVMVFTCYVAFFLGGEGEGMKRRRPRRYPDTIIDGNKEQVSTLMKEEGEQKEEREGG